MSSTLCCQCCTCSKHIIAIYRSLHEMVGWHHRFSGHESEQIPGDSEGQGSLACSSPGVAKSQTQLSD